MTGLKHLYLMTYYRTKIASIGGECQTALTGKSISVLSSVETPQQWIRFQSEGEVEEKHVSQSFQFHLKPFVAFCWRLDQMYQWLLAETARRSVPITSSSSTITGCSIQWDQSFECALTYVSHARKHPRMRTRCWKCTFVINGIIQLILA